MVDVLAGRVEHGNAKLCKEVVFLPISIDAHHFESMPGKVFMMKINGDEMPMLSFCSAKSASSSENITITFLILKSLFGTKDRCRKESRVFPEEAEEHCAGMRETHCHDD